MSLVNIGERVFVQVEVYTLVGLSEVVMVVVRLRVKSARLFGLP